MFGLYLDLLMVTWTMSTYYTQVCVLSVLEIWSLEGQTVLMFGFSSLEGFADPEIFNLLLSPFPRNFIVYFLMKYMLPQRIFWSQIHSPWISLVESGESHVVQWPVTSWVIRFRSSLALYPVPMMGARAALAFYTAISFISCHTCWMLTDKFPYSVYRLGILMRALSGFLKRGCLGKKAEPNPDLLPRSQTCSSTVPVFLSVPADYSRQGPAKWSCSTSWNCIVFSISL